MLRADKLKKIDIEIGVNLKSLSYNEEKALNYLRKTYPYSKIKIDYDLFEKNTTGVYYKNYKVQPNSVRFISQPKIKDKYVYITDIDILIFIIAVALGQYFSYIILNKEAFAKVYNYISLIVMILIYSYFLIATLIPGDGEIYVDPNTKMKGIKGHS